MSIIFFDRDISLDGFFAGDNRGDSNLNPAKIEYK